MKQYCRYCTYLVTGNGIYCTLLNRELSERYTKAVNSCGSFELNATDAYDENRTYSPRKKRARDGQMRLEL